MAFSLDIRPAVKDFVRDHPALSRHGRVAVYANLHGGLAACDPAAFQRVAPGSAHFWYEALLRDTGTGAFHNFRFAVSDADAAYGVLHVDYAEER